MNYTLNNQESKGEKRGFKDAFIKMWELMREEKRSLVIAVVAILLTSGLSLLGPYIVGYTIDTYIATKQYQGVLLFAGILVAIYGLSFIAQFIQMRVMGGVAQRVLFRLRNAVFTKLQQLPVAFFNQNKAGDLISRINSDTDKLNQFFSQSLMQFVGSLTTILGAGIFLVVINTRLGLSSIIPAVVLIIITRLLSGFIKRMNLKSLQATGAMSGEVQESLSNFKVIVAFNRRDYFRKKFDEANQENFKTSVRASFSNNALTPIYDFASNVAQLTVLLYGIYLITHGQFTLGLLVSFLTYINRFYDPLRQMASLWASLQVALAGWDRISEILHKGSDLEIIALPTTSDSATNDDSSQKDAALLEFKNVTFQYSEDKIVLNNINFVLEKGKTYALVGPTGGGKTTTASLLARLYDPTKGTVLLNGKNIRSYSHEERTKKIGFILQEPFLLTGTMKDNIMYGNEAYSTHSSEQLLEVLKQTGLDDLLQRFDKGLDTVVSSQGDGLSLGQRQIIAFIRALLRKPELLILDEATANIDTVTEQILETILSKLPKETTRVIIAHRLNTIANADEIFFVNGGTITQAGSMEKAVDMLLHNARTS